MKKLHARELSRNQSILRFDFILQHNWPIEQCPLHIRIFFGWKTNSPCFDLSIHWLIKQITNTFRNHFSRSYENRSNAMYVVVRFYNVSFSFYDTNCYKRENFLEINQYFALISYCNTIGQLNNALSILGFSLAGKKRSPCFDLFIHWLIKQITNTYLNHFSRSYENHSNLVKRLKP